MMWWHWGGLGWGMMGLGLIWMVLVWGALIALIIWDVRRLSGHHDYRMHNSSPLDAAKERYAKGEITKEQTSYRSC
jgi:putative membrane protein